MSAALCGSKRSFFEELLALPPLSKRIHCSTSPIRFNATSLLDQLISPFSHMDRHLLEIALEKCDNDIDVAIKRLNELCLGSAQENLGAAQEPEVNANEENQTTPNNLPADGAEWVDLFVKEMMSATNLDDARARVARVLEVLEKSISAWAGAEAAQTFQKHERPKEYEDKHQELQHLKQVVSQYQEQLRTLEVTNYTLSMHLK